MCIWTKQEELILTIYAPITLDMCNYLDNENDGSWCQLDSDVAIVSICCISSSWQQYLANVRHGRGCQGGGTGARISMQGGAPSLPSC